MPCLEATHQPHKWGCCIESHTQAIVAGGVLAVGLFVANDRGQITDLKRIVRHGGLQKGCLGAGKDFQSIFTYPAS